MSSLLRTKGVQIGQDNTATNNFTLYQPGVPDGTLRIGNGNSGSTTDALTINSSGRVGIGTSSPATKLHVEQSTTGEAFRVARGGNYLIMGGSGSGTQYVKGYEYVVSFGNIFNGPTTFLTNDTERMRIDESGRVTMPYQPSFLAYNSAAIACSTLSDGQIIAFDSTSLNRGSHYNTSTGLFTAPIAGDYIFSIYTRIDSIESTVNNYYHPGFKINGVLDYNGGAHMRQIVSSTTSQAFEFVSETVIFALNANDTVGFSHGDGSISGASAASAQYISRQSRFSGRLLG